MASDFLDYPNHRFDFGCYVKASTISGPVTGIRETSQGWNYQIAHHPSWIQEADLELSCPDGEDTAQTSAPCTHINQPS
jgi:hypothetical protein